MMQWTEHRLNASVKKCFCGIPIYSKHVHGSYCTHISQKPLAICASAYNYMSFGYDSTCFQARLAQKQSQSQSTWESSTSISTSEVSVVPEVLALTLRPGS